MKLKTLNLFILCIIICLTTLASTNFLIESILIQPSSGSSNFEIEIIDYATGGDVNKNSRIFSFMPKNNLTNQIISKSKNGTPLITMGSGEPKVMIIAGVHGEELPSQIAAIMLINNLKDKKLKGTVYIIPFTIPAATELCTRDYCGIDPNRAAETPGTPTWVLLNFALTHKIKYAADFHSTQPGGNPGKKVVMSSKDILYESFSIADFMSRETGSEITCHSVNPGALKNVFNSNGIPSVSAEVISCHGEADLKSINESYEQMISFLKYSGIL
ncbi:MAG: succinylglutamate desuccinylase/aspartoacylase family protein [Methanobacteriaceae archaeon]|nr:succinylglutamate desuccinylase/aspartoacylase family protein [Methanobacteriaceae archaeon]